MHDKQRLLSEIDLTASLRVLAESYEEISVLKMQKVRGSVLRTREFLADISGVFYEVRLSYRTEITSLMKQKQDKTSFSTLSKNGKTVAVFLSASAKLYGDIVFRVFDEFKHAILSEDSDIVLVGSLGRELYEEAQVKKPYVYFDLPDYAVGEEALKPVVAHLVPYEHVRIFYGRFLNVVTQVPIISSISGEEPYYGKKQGTTREEKFLFEPTLWTILNFFETQIFYSLFRQTVHEAELSRVASRINAMEEALGNIDGHAKQLNSAKRKLERAHANKKQLEAFSGISLWQTR